jgi:hypothetical protein
MATKFTFDAEKALEALVYIVSKSGSDVYATLKILYNADKYSLHKYGRFIAGDFYKALPKGPVPQGAYDILHYVRGIHSASEVPHSREALAPVGNHGLKALRAPNQDLLSEIDLECLDLAIEKHGKKPFGTLKNESHDAAYNATSPNQEIAVEAIASMASEKREVLLQYLSDRYPEKAC